MDLVPPPDATGVGRRFAVLWAGQTASLLGSNVSAAGVSIAAYLETGSVWWLSTLYLAIRLPGLLLASHAGDLVDRSDRRRVLVAADSVAGLTTGIALVLLLAGHLELWHLVAVALVGATVSAYQEPAYVSALPLLVPRQAVDRAQGMLQLGPALGLLAGPAIAGVLVGLGGIGAVLAFDAATFLLAIAAAAVTPVPSPARQESSDDPDVDLRGLRATWRSLTGRQRGLRHLLLFAGAFNLVLSVVNVLVFALLLPLAGETGTGAVLSVGGGAMLATAALVAARGVPARRVRTLAISTFVVGAGVIVAGLQPSVVVAAIGLMAVLAGAALGAAAAGTLFQTEVAPERQGRLTSLRRVAGEALVPFAVLGVAPLTERLAEPAMQPGGALAASVGTVLGTGTGRGVALLFVGVGLAVLAIGVGVLRDRTLGVLDRGVPAPAAGAAAAHAAVAPR